MKERQGFVFGQNEKSQEKEAAERRRPALDAYDRARQTLGHMANVSANGYMNDDTMAWFYCSTAIAESLLAVADAIYATNNLTRELIPQKKES